ncbi:uncharacterized protein LOC126894997 isoform X4 [Daktulosphaira vitifoliae]|uniref:uncharacterized protein LOC126894997 isoform X4 n=1 Tax=Daktulosphaira vitifoliae TaxID=58002 RepID=UPI0021AAF1D1|nr:uncharacterized protein LOC126894997 isoform X4 [Daktulosphaira vitifoliae]
MVLYFCFGILVFLVCFIPIPTFSAGSSNTEINKPEKITHEEFIKFVFDPELEKHQPMIFYTMQYVLNTFFEVSVENDKFILNRKKKIKNVPKSKLYNSLQVKNIKKETDETVLSILNQNFKILHLNGIHLKVLFEKYDIAKSGTVVEIRLKEIFEKNDLFPNVHVMEPIVKKYTKMNDFNYQKWFAEFCDNFDGDKSIFWTYNENTKKWEKKYPNFS